MEKKRLTSVKTHIKPITSGQFVKQEGFEPNYVMAGNGQKLSRVRLLATIVDKFNSESGKFAAVTLDDGTDTIRAKVFNSLMLEPIEKGAIVDVIGRIKEYNGEVYLAPEIITSVDPDYEILRELEIREQEKNMRKIRDIVHEYKNQTTDVVELSRIMKERFGVSEESTEAALNMKDTPSTSVSDKDSVLKLIESLDTGMGCVYSELLEKANLPEETMDAVVNELLSEGSCFEPKPGIIKKL